MAQNELLIDINNLPYNIAIYKYIDGDFIIVDMNENALKTESLNKEDIVNKKITDVFTEIKKSGLWDVLYEVHKTKQTKEFKLSFYKEDNKEAWHTSKVIANSDGTIMSIYKDKSSEIYKNQKLQTLGAMIDSSDNEYYIFEKDSLHFTYLNRAALKNIGYSMEEMSSMTPMEIKPDYDFQQFYRLLEPLLLEEETLSVFEVRHRRKDGSYYYVEARVQLMKINNKDQFVATILDISARKELENELKKLGHIVDNTQNELYIFELDTLKFQYFNTSAKENIGYELEEIIKLTPVDIKPEFTVTSFYEFLKPLINNKKEMIVFETKHKRKDGSLYDVEARVQLMDIDFKKVFVAIVVDISQRKKDEAKLLEQSQKLKYLATHDTLTSLPNRSLYFDRLEHAIKMANRNDTKIAVMYVDLDDFKKINDTYGHDIGDEVLKGVANNLKKVIRKCDTVSRFGGDEFVLLFENLNEKKDIDHIIKHLTSDDVKKVVIDGITYKITYSIGVSFQDKKDDTPRDILKNADHALYQVKHKDKNNYKIFNL